MLLLLLMVPSEGDLVAPGHGDEVMPLCLKTTSEQYTMIRTNATTQCVKVHTDDDGM